MPTSQNKKIDNFVAKKAKKKVTMTRRPRIKSQFLHSFLILWLLTTLTPTFNIWRCPSLVTAQQPLRGRVQGLKNPKRKRRARDTQTERYDNKLIAYMSDYPMVEESSELEEDQQFDYPRGTVVIQFGRNDKKSMWINMNMRGIPPNCQKFNNTYPTNGCGVHIHEGQTCSSHNLVAGHYWDKELFGNETENDPWINNLAKSSSKNDEKAASKFISMTTVKRSAPAVQYDSNALGESLDEWIYFEQGNGFNASQNLHRALVIHDENGTRKSCGVSLLMN